ncbi:MAG: hypothetical protein ACK5IH_16325, partial [Betaproteobacteria bacterium]
MVLAWWASGFLFQRPALRRWPAWTLLALAGAAAGVVLAPWSVVLEQALGVVDLEEPGAPPLPSTAVAWRAEVAGELLQVLPHTALLWVAMNLWVLWRASAPHVGHDQHRGEIGIGLRRIKPRHRGGPQLVRAVVV